MQHPNYPVGTGGKQQSLAWQLSLRLVKSTCFCYCKDGCTMSRRSLKWGTSTVASNGGLSLRLDSTGKDSYKMLRCLTQFCRCNRGYTTPQLSLNVPTFIGWGRTWTVVSSSGLSLAWTTDLASWPNIWLRGIKIWIYYSKWFTSGLHTLN